MKIKGLMEVEWEYDFTHDDIVGIDSAIVTPIDFGEGDRPIIELFGSDRGSAEDLASHICSLHNSSIKRKK